MLQKSKRGVAGGPEICALADLWSPIRSFYKLKRLRALLDKTNIGEWVIIGQLISRSLADKAPFNLTFGGLQMVNRSTAGAFDSIIA